MNITLWMPRLLTAAALMIGGPAAAAAADQNGPGELGPPGIGLAPGMPAFDQAPGASAGRNEKRAEDLYEDAREDLEEGRYERAIERFDQLIALESSRTDSALYWKAYSLAKTGNRVSALEALAVLQKQFADSRWLKDAKALELEVKQASGQPVSPASLDSDELKLLALRGLMQSDPEQAFPVIEKMLAGANSPRVKDRALFVVSQSRSPRARDLILSVAKGAGNPDLQLRAIRYIGIMGGAENRQILADIYRASTDAAVKRNILRSFMTAGDRERLSALARSETDASLRGEAVRQLGVMGATTELAELYRTETERDVKRSILQSMHIAGDAARLSELARAEKDPELRRTAIRNLGLLNTPGATDTLLAIYGSDASIEVRRAVVNALFIQGNATALITLARGEQDAQLKRHIVSQLSLMKSKAATDYMLELLK